MVKIIKNGRVIDPESRFDGRADLWIENGKIQKIVKKDTKAESDGASDAPSIPADAEVLDAEGLIVAPGLVDVHVHFRDPGLTYKEDIETGAAAAKAGGFTTVVCMANTKPVADTPEIVRYILEKGAKTGIHVETCAAVSKGFQGKELTDMDALKEAGAIGFTDDGIPLMSEKLVKEAMETAKRLNVPLSFHEEDPAFIFNNGINRGPVSEQLGIGGSPALAEDSMVARDCMIALHTGADVDIQHISSRNAVQMVGLAKKLGAHVWAEVTPHHFTLDETAVLEYGTLAKMNPPLRSREDRQALLEGLLDGTIDCIATDHAPHSAEEKAKGLRGSAMGIVGLETAFPILYTRLVQPGIVPLELLLDRLIVPRPALRVWFSLPGQDEDSCFFAGVYSMTQTLPDGTVQVLQEPDEGNYSAFGTTGGGRNVRLEFGQTLLEPYTVTCQTPDGSERRIFTQDELRGGRVPLLPGESADYTVAARLQGEDGSTYDAVFCFRYDRLAGGT